MKDKGLNKDQYELTPDALKKIIQQYTREAGVRNLERVIGKTANRVTTIRQMSEDPSNYGKITVTPELLEDKSYLGKPIFGKPETISGKIPGQVNGLAWTEYGGDTIITKVNAIPTNSGWNGNLVSHISATGNLQDIMKESVQYVSGYIRKHHTKFQIADEYKNGVELNIHFPAAAVPKDGPSAGVTIGTAIVSALTGIPVRSDVAMTGELDIDGKVRPIGGLREKVDAAFRAGVKKVIIPAENAKDIEQIPEAQREAIEIVPVEWFDEVLPHALSQSPLVKDAPVKKTFQIGFAPHAKKAE
jgi:ATP-dependent Lon protease